MKYFQVRNRAALGHFWTELFDKSQLIRNGAFLRGGLDVAKIKQNEKGASMIEEMKLEFMGFSPDIRSKDFVSLVVEKLHFSAPSDSIIKIGVEKNKDAIKATCRIASQAGTFVAEAIGDTPVRAVQKIETKIRAQLEQWKATRFL